MYRETASAVTAALVSAVCAEQDRSYHHSLASCDMGAVGAENTADAASTTPSVGNNDVSGLLLGHNENNLDCIKSKSYDFFI